VLSGSQSAELFFVVSYSGGQGIECGAEGGEFVGEAGEGAAGGGAVPVLVDDGAEVGVAVEGGSAQAGAGGHGGEGDGVTGVVQVGAGDQFGVERDRSLPC
jgi:hypothetical protein